jgi:hypothetical protein
MPGNRACALRWRIVSPTPAKCCTRALTPPRAGPAHVYDNGRLAWPHGRYDLCGDAWDAADKPLARPRLITGECVVLGQPAGACMR